MGYVQYWSKRTGIPKKRFFSMIGISKSKYYSWKKRCGMKNNHNSSVPRWFWLEDWEKEAIVAYHWKNSKEGYRRLSYMMIDEDVVYASPSTVYRVLKELGVIGKAKRKASKKGDGFNQPSEPHKHWHIDVTYINICGTFYFLCGLLDGYSRYVVHWELREEMTEKEVEIIVQRAREKYPDACPRIISDNGPQFIAKDFKEFIKLCSMTHVRTSPFYPQSNGKYERWNRTLKNECIRPKTPLSIEDAKRVMKEFVQYYNTKRLHSAVGFIAPLDKLEGRDGQIKAERKRKLANAKIKRKQNFIHKEKLTLQESQTIIPSAGETEAGNAGKQTARDNRSRQAKEIPMGAGNLSCPLPLKNTSFDASYALKKSAVSFFGNPQKCKGQKSNSR